MSRNKQLSEAVHRALYSVAIVTTAASIPTLAQAQATTDPASSEVIEEIVTTGSRIATDPNLTTSSPVTKVDASELVYRGITRVEDLVNDLPQMVPEFTSNDSNGATGTATLDLRGLGSYRTLVLTNGHRMGFGDPYVLSPDVNQVPGALIERVEILTGGASSVYGADAVSGVVNFVMRDDFEGFQFDWQYSGYQHENNNSAVRADVEAAGFAQTPSSSRDGGTTDINVVIGVNSDDGRGNVTGYLGYRDINAVFWGDRDYASCALASGGDGTGCSGSATLPTGLFTPFDGSYYFTVAGDQFVPWDYTYYNFGPANYFQRPDERITAGMFGRFEISESVEGYTEVQFMDDRSLAQIAPSGAFFVTDTLNCDNALLSAQQFAAIGCTALTDVVPLYIGRRNVEGGPRFDDLRHTNMRTLVGLRGDITDSWSYDAYANFSRLRFSQVYNNDMSITRIVRSFDAVDDGAGNIVCQSVLDGSDPGCVPWNVFETGGATQAAIDYLTLPLFSKADVEQDQAVAYVTGDLTDAGVVMPTAIDGVKLVFGAEYRDESMDFNPDQGFRSGDGAGQGGPVPAVSGSVIAKELFTEVKIPIVQDRPGFESLSLDLRYRYSDYDLDVQTDTWNVGGEYRPVESLMFRGGVSQAVRVPNLNELFQPQSLGLWGGTDPCAGAAPQLTAAQCANTGVTAAQYGNIPLSPAGQYNATYGGNPDLEAETSDSMTVGAVFTPSGALDGLSLSVDYWSIEVTDAVSSGIGEEFTIRECGLTGDAAFCSLINRGPNGNLWIGSNAFVLSTDINIGFYDVAGIDITAAYGMEVGNMGSLDFAFRGTILDKFDQQPVPGATVEECAGRWGDSCERPRPEWKHTFNVVWGTPWDTDLVLGWRNVGAVDQFGTTDGFNASAQDYIDLAATYTADWFGGTTELSAGVTNVFDEDPPVNGLIGNADYSNGNTFPGTWDPLGRYYFVGFTMSY